MLNPPDKIYLQFYGSQGPLSADEVVDIDVGDVTWCKDSIWEHDVLYFKSDQVIEFQKTLKKVQKTLKKAIKLLKTCRDNPAHMQMSLHNDIQDFLHYND